MIAAILQRKVGAPQDNTLANGQAQRCDGKCNRKQTANGSPVSTGTKGEIRCLPAKGKGETEV